MGGPERESFKLIVKKGAAACATAMEIDDDRTTGSLSWALQLQRYLQANAAGKASLLAERKALVELLQADPTSAQAWDDFLANEEAIAASCGAGGAKDSRAASALGHLYQRAIELVPRTSGSGSDAFMRLWIGHARQQWLRNEDEGRDLFKAIKNQHLGDNCAALYQQWALLEHQSGNTAKAVTIVQKGLKEQAEPRRVLEQLLAQLQLGTVLAADMTGEPIPVPLERKVHFQDGTLLESMGGGVGDGLPPSARRAPPSTPGTSLRAADHTTSTGYTHLSGASSASKSSTGLLPTDLSMALSGHQNAQGAGGLPSGYLPSKSQATCHSHSSEEDTINCRSADENRTNGVYGVASSRSGRAGGSGAAGAGAGGGGGNTATMTLPAGISGLNLAAGAAAVAALGSSAAPAGGSGAGPSGGGNNTGNMSLGLKRFGLKSKAVRITGGGAQVEGSSPSAGGAPAAAALPGGGVGAAGGGMGGAALGDVREVQDQAAAPHAQHAGSASLQGPVLPSAAGSAAAAAAAPSAGHGAWALDDPDEALSRKRRAAAAAAVSPLRQSDSALLLQDEGAKRRQSPELASAMSGAQASRGGYAEAPGMQLGGRVAHAAAAGGSDANAMQLDPHSCFAAAASAPYSAGGSLAARPAAPATPAGAMLPPAPSAGTGLAHRPLLTALSRQYATPTAGLARQAAPCADENMAPAATAAQVADENMAPGAAAGMGAAAGVAGGSSVKPPPKPAPVGMPPPQPQQQSAVDGREPLRPVGHLPSRPSPAPHAAIAQQQPMQQQPVQQQQPAQHQQQPMAPQPRSQRAMQPGAPQAAPAAAGGFSWPERLEQPQARPIESEMYVYVHGIRYQKLDMAGKGGSSKVYKVLGLNRGIYALKRVRFQNKDPEAVKGFIDEITLLRQLRGKPNIIQLIDAQVFREDGLVYMVLEYGDIDLARLLHSHEEARKRNAAAAAEGAAAAAADGASAAPATGAASDGAGAAAAAQEIDANFIRLYWQQMLQAVKCIHDMRIVHADLKPANFMLVQGQLKLIDFGIAKAIQGDTTSINRESQVGTLNYMSPEAIQGGSQNPLGGPPLKVGRPSDVWSLGCILYQMIYGRTPFADLSFIPKMNAICNPAYQVPTPECGEQDAVDVIKSCLDRNPKTRISLQELLDHPFLHPNRRKQAQQQAQQPPATAAAAQGGGAGLMAGLTEEQIKAILQLGVAGAGGASGDLDSMARRVMQQLSQQAPGAAAPQQQPQQAAAPARAPAPPPPPPPPPPPLFSAAAPRAAAPPPPPPPPPPPMAFAGAGGLGGAGAAPAPPPAAAPRAAQPAAGGGSMGDIAAMAAAAAAKRAARPPIDVDQARAAAAAAAAAAATRPNPLAALSSSGQPAGGGMLPLAGAELHAAILQQRSQLRPVQEQGQQGPGQGQQPGGGGGAQGGDVDNGLEAVLRRGLERFHFGDSGPDTHGNTAFIEAAMCARRDV